MRRISIAVVIVGMACARGAAAAPDVKADFKQYMKDLVAAPETANQFVAGCQFLFLPAASSAEVNPTSLTVADLLGSTTGAVTLKPSNLHSGKVDGGEWITADVDATIKDGANKRVVHLRMSGLVGRGKGAAYHGRHLAAGSWAVAVPDKDAIAQAIAGTLPALAEVPDTASGDNAQFVRSLDRTFLGAELSFEKGAVVIGSAPKQTVLGGPAGEKTIKGWKLELAQDGGIVTGQVAETDAHGVFAVTHMNATMKVKGKDVTIPFRVFVVLNSNGQDTTFWVAHFSIGI